MISFFFLLLNSIYIVLPLTQLYITRGALSTSKYR